MTCPRFRSSRAGQQLPQQLHGLQPYRQLQAGNGRAPATSHLQAQSSSGSMGLQHQGHDYQTSVFLPGLRQPQQHARQVVACEAMFGWWGGSSKASSSSKLAERPLYNKREMFDLGGLQVRSSSSITLSLSSRVLDVSGCTCGPAHQCHWASPGVQACTTLQGGCTSQAQPMVLQAVASC
jgi:hypothetical protein